MSSTTTRSHTSCRLATLAAATAMVVFVASACGGDDAGDSSTAPTTAASTAAPTTAAAEPTTAPAGDAGIRTIDTPHGAVDVPGAPERIVSVQASTSSALFDLGVTPLAVYDEGEEYVSARYLERWQAADKIGSAGEFNFEAITALDPDLIVGIDYAFIGEQYDSFAAIAPTVLVDSTTSWQEQVAAIADAAGAGDAVAALAEAYVARTAEIAADHAGPLAATHWAFIQGGFDAGNYWIYGPETPVVGIAEDAGVQLSSASAAAGQNNSVSYEEADLLTDADVIVFYAGADDGPLNDLDQLFAMPVFEGLPAVQADHLLPMADFLPGSYGDAMGVLDGIESMLIELG